MQSNGGYSYSKANSPTGRLGRATQRGPQAPPLGSQNECNYRIGYLGGPTSPAQLRRQSLEGVYPSLPMDYCHFDHNCNYNQTNRFNYVNEDNPYGPQDFFCYNSDLYSPPNSRGRQFAGPRYDRAFPPGMPGMPQYFPCDMSCVPPKRQQSPPPPSGPPGAFSRRPQTPSTYESDENTEDVCECCACARSDQHEDDTDSVYDTVAPDEDNRQCCGCPPFDSGHNRIKSPEPSALVREMPAHANGKPAADRNGRLSNPEQKRGKKAECTCKPDPKKNDSKDTATQSQHSSFHRDNAAVDPPLQRNSNNFGRHSNEQEYGAPVMKPAYNSKEAYDLPLNDQRKYHGAGAGKERVTRRIDLDDGDVSYTGSDLFCRRAAHHDLRNIQSTTPIQEKQPGEKPEDARYFSDSSDTPNLCPNASCTYCKDIHMQQRQQQQQQKYHEKYPQPPQQPQEPYQEQTAHQQPQTYERHQQERHQRQAQPYQPHQSRRQQINKEQFAGSPKICTDSTCTRRSLQQQQQDQQRSNLHQNHEQQLQENQQYQSNDSRPQDPNHQQVQPHPGPYQTHQSRHHTTNKDQLFGSPRICTDATCPRRATQQIPDQQPNNPIPPEYHRQSQPYQGQQLPRPSQHLHKDQQQQQQQQPLEVSPRICLESMCPYKKHARRSQQPSVPPSPNQETVSRKGDAEPGSRPSKESVGNKTRANTSFEKGDTQPEELQKAKGSSGMVTEFPMSKDHIDAKESAENLLITQQTQLPQSSNKSRMQTDDSRTSQIIASSKDVAYTSATRVYAAGLPPVEEVSGENSVSSNAKSDRSQVTSVRPPVAVYNVGVQHPSALMLGAVTQTTRQVQLKPNVPPLFRTKPSKSRKCLVHSYPLTNRKPSPSRPAASKFKHVEK